MKKWLTIALALAAALAVVGQFAITADAQSSGTNPGWTGRVTSKGYPEIDFAPNKPGNPVVYDEIVPHVLIKFDDGRAGVDADNPPKKQIAAFLRRGIPVALALNANNIGTSGYMSWNDVRELQQFAQGHGTTLHIMSHFNNNLPTPFALDHSEIVDEMDPSLIYRETGYRVRCLVLPGDAGRQEWQRRNREYAQSVADSLGLWWIQHIVPNDSTEIQNFNPSIIEMDTYASSESSFRLGDTFLSFVRPGMGIPRNNVPTAGINDIQGAYAVERVESYLAEDFEPNGSESTNNYGYEFRTGVKPPRHDGWTLASKGANPAGSTPYTQTFWAYVARNLAGNYGFTITMHDSASAGITSEITGVDNTEILNHWSPDHVAWAIAMLVKRGHIKAVGPEEFMQWATGDIAVGTDLINNPYCLIPQYDIGDTLGGTSEYPLPRGLTMISTSAGAQPNTTNWIRTLQVEQTGNVAKWNRASSNNPYDLIGLGVTGVRGRKGGISMNGTNPTIVRFSQGNLPPGRYRFSLAVNAAASNALVLNEMHTGVKVKGFMPNLTAENGFSTTYADTLLRYQWRDADIAPALPATVGVDTWGDFTLAFDFPYGWTGDLGSSSDGLSLFGRSDEATGTFFPQPYANGVAEFIPLLASARWGFTLQLVSQNTLTLSNPRLIYLGDH